MEPDLLFTENDTNFTRLWGVPNKSPYVKDAFHDHIIPAHRLSSDPFVNGRSKATFDDKVTNVANGSDSDSSSGRATPVPHQSPQFVNPDKTGTKSAALYIFRDVPGKGGCAVVRMKLTPNTPQKDPTLED